MINLHIRFVVIFMVMASVSYADADSALRLEAIRQTKSIQQGAAHWPVSETEFFEIHFHPSIVPDSVACFELDAFVERVLNDLDESGAIEEKLRQQKLSYYLCDDQTVERLTGYATRGMADLAGRAVISSHFPHFHELAHLLVDLSLKEPALQTHPLLQEGVACLLGGRWGRAPATILYTSWVHRNFEMGKLDDLMTRDGFFSCSGGADVAYALGAMFCEVVRREAGWIGVLELYEELSGSVEYVSSLTAENIVSSVATVCEWPLNDAVFRLEEAMNQAMDDNRRCGISPPSEEQSAGPVKVISREKTELKTWQTPDHFGFHITSDAFPVYLVSPASQHGGNSSIFSEHLPNEKYQGQRFGLRISENDIALYDFSTNQLLATWVAGFTDEAGACGDEYSGVFFDLSGPAFGSVELLTAEGCKLIH